MIKWVGKLNFRLYLNYIKMVLGFLIVDKFGRE